MKIKKNIIKKFVNDKFSMNDHQEVKDYFGNDHFEESLNDSMQSEWKQTNEEKIKLAHILQLLHEKMGLVSDLTLSQKIVRSFSRIAAILILPALITIAFLAYQSTKENQIEESWIEIHSPAGSRTNFQLPDGSTGWLNSSSSIKYLAQFNKNREVEISGEVWFDVVHKNKAEFKVKTPYFDVKVLGTQFNIAAYSNEETAQVSLDKGKVEIVGKNQKIWTSLQPNQQIIFNNKNKKFTKSAFDSKSYSAWKDGLLAFKNVPFSEIAKRVGRKYNAQIIIHDESLNSAIFRATFEDETLDEICKLLVEVVPITYKIHKRNIQADGTFSKNRIEIWPK